MKKRLSISLVTCFSGSILIVAILMALSQGMQNTQGNFLRLVRSHPTKQILDIDLKVNSFYLAGSTPTRSYLGNYTSRLLVLEVEHATSDTSYHNMTADGIYTQKFWSLVTKIDSPYFFLHDGAVPRIYRGHVNDWRAERFERDKEFFVDLTPMNENSIAIRSMTGDDHHSVLGTISSGHPDWIFNQSVLVKQRDGFFCTDGYLQYDKSSGHLVWLYRYRNEYIVLDSSLTPLHTATTIDTNTVAKIETATIESSNSRVLASPPLVVNNGSAVSGDCMFVNSALTAHNEPADAQANLSTIDVYDLAERKYQFSFYIFDYSEKERLREFQVAGNKFIALFPTHLVVYELNQDYFKKKLID